MQLDDQFFLPLIFEMIQNPCRILALQEVAMKGWNLRYAMGSDSYAASSAPPVRADACAIVAGSSTGRVRAGRETCGGTAYGAPLPASDLRTGTPPPRTCLPSAG